MGVLGILKGVFVYEELIRAVFPGAFNGDETNGAEKEDNYANYYAKC